ncbi:MAG: NADH-dependent alcohol dehydrogenase, partial [Turicibacter sp.]|nr:NADH-dependent alcohol dehydrogenase [Turicibacter sp.]
AIHCLEQFFKDLNLPVRFSEANLPTHEIELLAQKLLSDRPSVGRFVTIDKQAAIAIYQLAL